MAGVSRARRRARRLLQAALVLVALGVLATVVALWTIDPAASPPAPDHRAASLVAWAALPELEDGADVSLPELPAGDQTRAPVGPTAALG